MGNALQYGGRMMAGRIIFATGNKDKVREIKGIFGDLPYEILTLKKYF